MTTATVTHTYQPRGAAKALLETRADEILLSGPAGTGKSRACLEKLHLQALKYPGMRGLVVRKTQTSLGSTALVTWREKVAVEAIRAGEVRWYGGSQQEAAQYRYRNGSTITVGGLDKSSKIMSSEYDVAFVQEAIELVEGDWEAITTRLRNGRLPYQQLMADTNPDAPHHWLNVRAQRGATLMLHSRHRDNPLLFDDDGTPTERGAAYLAKLEALTGVRRARLYLGQWVAAEGLIYEEYDPAIHLIDRFKIPDSWPRFWAVDFGYTNPMVIQCWAEDPDGRLYLYREIYRTRRTVDQHAADILKVVAPKGEWIEPRPRQIVCDHDAEGRAVLERELGMGTTAARKAVTEGIQAFQARLRPAGDGRPRIYFLRDSVVFRDPELEDAKKPTSTVEEIVGYVWAVKPGGQLKEEPQKENDHGMDGGRYLVAERDLGVPARVRFI
jgi:phage terminase large subunit